jgi:hypothetical protein
MYLGISLEGWLTISAIILGPLLAFVVQNWRDHRRERENRRVEIFRKLVLTLKVNMAPVHVDAINSIPLEFHSEADVMKAWRLYTSHLNQHQAVKADPNAWAERKFNLLVDLVHKIGQSLGYDHLDEAALRDNLYVPQGYADVEEEMRQIRVAWLQVLNAKRAIPMTMLGPVQVESPLELLPEIQQPRPALRPQIQSALPAVNPKAGDRNGAPPPDRPDQ